MHAVSVFYDGLASLEYIEYNVPYNKENQIPL